MHVHACAGKPLSVELGPGLLTTIFDGIQRPLKAIAVSCGDVFIPRGVDVPALDRKKAYEFAPSKVKVRAVCEAAPGEPALVSASERDRALSSCNCTAVQQTARLEHLGSGIASSKVIHVCEQRSPGCTSVTALRRTPRRCWL